MPRISFALLILWAGMAAAPDPPAQPFVQAVEFPFNRMPRNLWERELVWLKNIGIDMVAFAIPEQGSEWREFLRLLRRLEMKAWIRGVPPRNLETELTPQLARHGGPIAFVEGAPAGSEAPRPPAPVVLAATDPQALARSRLALAAGRTALLWTDVEDSLYPVYRAGAVSLSGDERPGAASLRRSAYLLRYWAALIPSMRSQRAVRPASGKLPPQVTALQLSSPGPDGSSAVALVNQSAKPFSQPLRVYDPRQKTSFILPPVGVAAGQAFWLPVSVPLSYGGLCRDCTGFARRDRLVYATAELQSVEYENGIVAMEFAAPTGGEAVLELSAQPTGPYLAAGSPAEFEWDPKLMHARLRVPPGKGPASRVRIGLAIEPPEHTAFFVNPTRLVMGRKNIISTSYSSPELAGRSRLLAPAGYGLKAQTKSATEIDYQVTVPDTALHGEFVELALEADGVRLGRARVQIFRPVSIRVREVAALHFGATELRIDPPLVAFDPRSGRAIDIVVRNNAPSIETFTVAASGDGLEFVPSGTEMAIGAIAERSFSPRVFGPDLSSGIYNAAVRLGKAATVLQPLRFVAIRRGEALAYSLDLDGDDSPEFVLENQRIRAVFSARAGGRWVEFVWKETGANMLPEAGAFQAANPVQCRLDNRGQEASLEIAGAGWRRIVRVTGGASQVSVEQDTALPEETLSERKTGQVILRISRSAPNRAVYALERTAGTRTDSPAAPSSLK